MNPCLVCGGTYRPFNIPGLVSCASCGFVSADVALSAEELKALYGRQYFQGEEYRDYIDDRLVIEKHFLSRLKKLLEFVPNPQNKSIFEIGSAYGFFLAVAQKYFATVEGVDISTDAVMFARQELHLPVAEADFLDYTPSRSVDVACLWDTVEHLESPHLYLEKLSGVMSAGGIIAITTGDVGSAVARMRGRHWRQIHPPTHLHYFSKQTLTDLLTRHGFRVCYSGSDGQYRSLATIAYVILMIKHRQPSVYDALKRTGILRFSVYLNLFDIMYLIARKQ